MAKVEGARAKPKASKRESAARKPQPAVGNPTMERLQGENAALKKRLAAAEERIALLERQREEALNRMAWVIDSINTLVETIS